VHAAACVGVGLVFSAWTTVLIVVFKPFGPPEAIGFFQHWFTNFYDGLPGTVVYYVCILMIRNVLDSRENAAKHKTELAQLNEQLAHAHLAALRRQIEPHFLFNALNTVSGLVREGNGEAAVDTIAALSDFLRRSLADSGRQEVRLRDEMDFVQRYLSIQKARFADRLNVDVDVPNELLDACVPNLILQPLVENAIKHGISRLRSGGTVHVSATAVRNVLILIVSNDGPVLAPPSDSRQDGIGVSNVRSRLRGLYGDASAFEMRGRPGGGLEVSISMPLRSAATVGETTVEHKPA
jgi:LytS/YehU family sensor histidine kinase